VPNPGALESASRSPHRASTKEKLMKKFIPATVLIAVFTVVPFTAGTAWAAKNCPEGSHKGKGPDPSMVYCYDNLDLERVVKVFPA
jgi:hypothetical protein